jgi:CRP/FNR family transcriptional regulator, cyclic AMP receptor protein
VRTYPDDIFVPATATGEQKRVAPDRAPLRPSKAVHRSNLPRRRKRLIVREAPVGGSSIRQPNLLVKLLALDPKVLAAKVKFRRYPAGELIFQQGDRQRGLHIIKTGTVRAFYTAPSGREITLAYWQAGDLLGADRLYGGGVFRWSCQTVAPTEAYLIVDADLRTLIANVPELAVALIEALSFKVQWLSGLVQALGTESVSRRLAQVLDTLCELYGVQSDQGIAIDAPFTHEDLAAMVGASRQWVTMALARFQDRGVLKLGKRRIEVLRRDRLVSSSRNHSVNSLTDIRARQNAI